MAKDAPLIALFGSPAIIEQGESRMLRASEKTLSLLVLLVCHAERPLSRAWLASMLWPDVDEAEARTNLRRHLYLLTKALPPEQGEYVTLTRSTAQWDRNACARCDVIDFLRALEARDYESALAAYSGPLCIGNFEDPVLEQRERLQRLYVDTLRESIDYARRDGESAKCLLLLERLAAQDPLNEAWTRELAQARLNSGDRTGARRDLTALAARLRSELGVEPEDETARLLLSCMEQEQTRGAGNLPPETTSFVGREPAVHELAKRLTANSWVTIAGPGGIGKTRLAIHTARSTIAEYPDGAWFVDLASVTTWDDALRRIASVFSLSIDSDPAGALRQYIARRRMLLILDNLEQLDDSAAAGIECLVSAGTATIFATSRRRLGGEGENVYPLEQLSLAPLNATPADALHYASVRLFVERALTVAPAFALSHENVAHVAAIVRRLDGLPLAIELVAARANLLTIEGMAKRLDDLGAFRHKNRDDRHQTVTDAVRWSYDLLAPREQLLLQRLSVFEGPFDLPAIEAICGDAFAVLSELVEASLVVVAADAEGEQRYALLETVRQFLRALPGCAAQALQNEHARYFAQLALEAEIAYDDVGAERYVSLLRRHDANFEAALRYAWEKRDAKLVATFVACLVRDWPPYETKRRAFLFEFLSAAIAPEWDAELRARALTALGSYASTEADWQRCKEWRAQAAAVWRSLGNEPEALMMDAMIAYAESYLGASLSDVTLPSLYRIADRLRQIGAPDWCLARIEYNLGSMELALGNADVALQLILSAVAVVRRERRVNYIASCLAILTRIYVDRNELELAERCVEEALQITEDRAFAVLHAQALGDRARVLLAKNKPLEALRSCAESLDAYEQAYELRFVSRTVTTAMEALLEIGSPERSARIAGHLLHAGESTGTATVRTFLRQSPAFERTQAALGDAFDGYLRLGATLTHRDVCAEVWAAVEQAASSREDVSRTIASL